MKFFKEIKEAYNNRDAYQRDYDHSVAGMGKRQSLAYQQDGGANDEGWDRPQYQAPQETYYIRFKDTGVVYKQKGAPKSFSNKAGANAYALAMIKNNPALKGNLLLSVDSNDKPAETKLQEGSAEDLPMYGAIIHRIMVAHTDVLAKYGPEKIMSAAEDEAEWVGDVEEIGSSDVSISVKRVIQALEEQHGVKESESPESELERLKLRQNAEHGHASLKRQAETQARIRELEKQQARDAFGSMFGGGNPADKLSIRKKDVEEAAQGHTIEAHGVRGMDRKTWHKTFKNVDQMNAWAEKYDAEIHGTRDLEQAKHGNLSPAMQGVAEGNNPTDVINVDVPMLLRVMEFAREDAQSDVDLHKVAERLTQLSADGRTVTIDDYNSVVSDMKSSIEEAEMNTGNQGYDNMLAVMKAVDAGQDAK